MLHRSHRTKLAALSQVALACYTLILFTATHLPVGASLLPGRSADKILHLFAYALFALLIATTWQLVAGWLTPRHLCWAWVAIVLAGAVDELTQSPIGRRASIWDWLADAAGAAIGLLVFTWLRRTIAARRERDSENSGDTPRHTAYQ